MIIIIAALILICGLIYYIIENNVLQTEYFTAELNIPTEFDKYRIAHISDLHNKKIGRDNRKLTAAVKNANVNAIFVTGDVVDSRNPRPLVGLSLFEELCKIAPCYYVIGNHELRQILRGELNEYFETVKALGVKILNDEKVYLEAGKAKIGLVGVEDKLERDAEYVVKRLCDDDFDIVLIHRPEKFEDCAENGADIVFAGHAHGGQIRIPFFGGIFAPGQGLHPKYTGGMYKYKKSVLILSRGIGSSIFPCRVNNRPNLIILEMKK